MKKATIYDVAQAAGYSAMTVTRAFQEGSVINPKTRERILYEAERLGFTPSRAASRLSKPEILISAALFDAVPELTAQQLTGFREIEDELQNLKVRISCHVFSKREELPGVLDAIGEEKPGGLILMSDTLTDEAARRIKQMQAQGVRLAVVACPHPALTPDVCVVVDAITSGRIAAQLLGNLDACVFLGNAQAELHRKALESFREASAHYGTRLGKVYDTKEDPELSGRQVRSMLAEGVPAGIYISTANSCRILAELRASGLGNRVRIICTDFLLHIQSAIRRDEVYATLFSDPPYQVKTACRSLFRLIADGEQPFLTPTRPQIVLSSNMDAYSCYL